MYTRKGVVVTKKKYLDTLQLQFFYLSLPFASALSSCYSYFFLLLSRPYTPSTFLFLILFLID